MQETVRTEYRNTRDRITVIQKTEIQEYKSTKTEKQETGVQEYRIQRHIVKELTEYKTGIQETVPARSGANVGAQTNPQRPPFRLSPGTTRGDWGGDTGSYGGTALHKVAFKGHTELCRLLILDRNFLLNNRQTTIIVISIPAENRANVNATDGSQRSSQSRALPRMAGPRWLQCRSAPDTGSNLDGHSVPGRILASNNGFSFFQKIRKLWYGLYNISKGERMYTSSFRFR